MQPLKKQRSLSTKLRHAPTRYEPVGRIAVGGMAEVWHAEAIFETGEHQPVAIKRVRSSIKDRHYRAMFEDEGRLGMLLRHPNVVRVYDARDVGDAFLMVMELVDGDSLRALLERPLETKTPMPTELALYITREVAKALAYSHSATDASGQPLGLVHRDISPHNILLGRDGCVKLADFGLADASVHRSVRADDLVGGKLGYLAPEVIEQNPSDQRVDLFGLGIVLWEMLAGQRLFQAAHDSKTIQNVLRCEVRDICGLNPSVPPAVSGLLQHLLARDPDQRPESASNIVKRLDLMISEYAPRVSSRDVALTVRLHLVRREHPTLPEVAKGMAELLDGELQVLARGAAGTVTDLGISDNCIDS